MTLVDTSTWIQSLRSDGDSRTADRVRALLEAGEAAWCYMIKLELWNGAQGQHEQGVLRDMGKNLMELETHADVWALSLDVARKARREGMSVPATNLLIWACALHYGVELEHTGRHFDMLSDLWNKR